MKKTFLLGLVSSFLIVLIGCATATRPTLEQINSANYGPLPQNWENITKEALAQELVRPESLYIREIKAPEKAWVMTPDGEFIAGWRVCGLIVMGTSRLEPFLLILNEEQVIFKALGFDLAIRVPAKKWMHRGASVGFYDACRNLFK